VPTPAADVYSIGVMLYEMLTGVPPFHDPDPAVLAMKHCREEPPPLTALNPKIPTGLDWLVRKILSKDPTRRHRNADQLGIALDNYLSIGQDGTGPRPPVVQETPVVPARTLEEVSGELPPAAGGSLGTQPVVKATVGFDSTLWMLIGVAAVAVIGLIPLWLFVTRAYTAPVVVPTPAPGTTVAVPTPGSETLVTVPNLGGLSAADAQRLAESVGLNLEVIGEEETSDVRPGAVAQQTPGVGTRVPVSDTVSVILAAGRPLVMPDIVGYDLDTVQLGLESDGLLVATVELRSPETKGRVLEQEPVAEIEMRAGDTVTLTVSGGGDVAILLGVNLNGQVLLEQAWVSQFAYRPGDTVPVTLRWRCLAPFGSSYQVFIHILTVDGGALIAQRDIVPVNGLRPTTSWAAGEIISDPHQIALPDDTPAGTYQVRVGLYDAGGRLPVADAGETQVLDDTIFVTTIAVQ
jgi:serine/threonine-protein kinase